MSSVDEILKGLNPQQKEAVTHGEGPLLVVAGAGTGKTRVITHRIAYLIAEKMAKPGEILALTFTEKAAAEMEERVDRLVPYGYVDTWISTFHAFGDHVLREYGLELGIPSDFKVLSRPEQAVFFQENLFRFPLDEFRPLSDPTRYIHAILTLISRAKDEDVTPEEYLNFAQESLSNASTDEERRDAQREMEIARTYQTYEELKTKAGFVDFGDQVVLLLRLLRTHPHIRGKLQEEFRYILIDEFQDTNYSQFQWVNQLGSRNKNIVVVGDDDQSIYKFRGAAISNILGFKETYPDAREIVLTQNYRSTRSILDSAYSLITMNNPDRLEAKHGFDKRLTPHLERDGSPPRHSHYETPSSEADGVVNEIDKRYKTGKYRYRDFAILVRANNDAKPFIQTLNLRRIPWNFSGNQGLYQREEIRILLSFLRALTDLFDIPSLFYLAASELYRVDPYDLTLALNLAEKKNKTLHEFFSEIRSGEDPEVQIRISEEGKAKITRLLEDLEKYREIARERTTGEVLYQFLMGSGFLGQLTNTPSREKEERIKNIGKFFEIVTKTSTILPYDRAHLFTKHLNHLIEGGESPPVAEADPEEDGVQLLTFHKAKGLEFPNVFLVGLVDNRFPARHRREQIELSDALVREKEVLPSGDFHIQEERRLFYVGMTRAMDEVIFTSARDYGGNRPRKVSRFVLEALDLPKVEPPLLKGSPIEAIKRYDTPPSKEKEEETLREEGAPYSNHESRIANHEIRLTPYQVDDYTTCPLKYKYIHILRIPLAQHHAVVYGKAIHEAIREYNRRKVAKAPVTPEDLIQIFKNSWRSEGFLSREHEDERFRRGCETLTRFFEREEESTTGGPTFVEKSFHFRIKNPKSKIRDVKISGRWDRVDVHNGNVVIIDYKSSDVRQQDKATKKARDNLQLSIYALGYSTTQSQKPNSQAPIHVELYFLESGLIGEVEKKERDFERTEKIITEVAEGIGRRDFTARPNFQACSYCPFNQICPYTATGGSVEMESRE
jgi:DNA helicase-2/ATP-dependent DNA helicase PcrA